MMNDVLHKNCIGEGRDHVVKAKGMAEAVAEAESLVRATWILAMTM